MRSIANDSAVRGCDDRVAALEYRGRVEQRERRGKAFDDLGSVVHPIVSSARERVCRGRQPMRLRQRRAQFAT